ncbi:MAG: isoprenylcysteine carboxylmethyltransferase family protein [Longimicrobiales bacterium]
MTFRWIALAVFAASLSISALHRWHARRVSGAIPRTAESAGLIVARLSVALPLFGGVVAYLANPRWMAWAALDLPNWARWIGVGLGFAVVPAVYWTMSTLGPSVSETVLTKPHHRLITTGPYRWVRHPLYSSAIALLLAVGLMAANWFILLWTAIALAGIRVMIIPREEANLVAVFGDEYRRYALRTGVLLPIYVLRSPRS